MVVFIPLRYLLGQPIGVLLDCTCLNSGPGLYPFSVLLVLFPGTVSVDVDFMPMSSSSLRRALRDGASVVHLQSQKPAVDHVRVDVWHTVAESIFASSTFRFSFFMGKWFDFFINSKVNLMKTGVMESSRWLARVDMLISPYL